MAALVRQPFAPLDGARLQSLTSMKNVQNCKCQACRNSIAPPPSLIARLVDGRCGGLPRRSAQRSLADQTAAIPISSPGKRKAIELLDVNDFENVDPKALFKRAKSGSDASGKDFFKPSTFILTKSPSTPTFSSSKDGLSAPMYSSPLKGISPRPRSILNPKSPAKKVNSGLSKAHKAPMSAPAGRSPTRGNKRVGILNRRRAGRVDPPSFNLFSAPFSLDAAIKGTLPSYAGRSSSAKASSSASDSLHEPSLKASWFFDIHEDTPEQEMTNLLQHSTCMLDISSDEECAQKLRREKAEGRGKENIPPADDISQTSIRRATTTVSEGGMEYEKPRVALGDLNAEDFYAEGVDPKEMIIVPGDEDDGTIVDGEQAPEAQQQDSYFPTSEVASEVNVAIKAVADVPSDPQRPATPERQATLQPVEGTGESFDLWESSSAKEEGDGAPSPVPASPASDFAEGEGLDVAY